MTPNPPDPASAATARTESGAVCFCGEQFPDSAPARKFQARILVWRFGGRTPHLRLVPPPSPPRPRRLDARISAAGGDPLAFVVSLNLARRHLSESQRAMAAGKIATLKDGRRSDLVQGLPIGRAAEMLNVGERSVAKSVLDDGVPELVDKVERGDVSVFAAAELAPPSRAGTTRDRRARLKRDPCAVARRMTCEKLNCSTLLGGALQKLAEARAE